MNNKLKNFALIGMLCSFQAIAEPRLRPTIWAVPVIGTTMENLYWIDSNIYRSEQPEDENFGDLTKLGIKEVLNLREYHDDADAKERNFHVHRVPMKTGNITEAQLLQALTVIKNHQSGLLIHCWHGSDRTGATVAAYRMVFQNWSKPQALDEMKNGGYGYHATIYPNIVDLINNLDVAKMKQQLQIN